MMYELGKGAFNFLLAYGIIDTLIIIAFNLSGLGVSPYLTAFFTVNGSNFISAALQVAGLAANAPIHLDIATIFFIFIIPKAYIYILNFLSALAIGLPSLVWNLASAFAIPPVITVVMLLFAGILQAFAWFYMVDSMISYFFGKPLFTQYF
jgi:hypothetical protein